MITTQPCDPSGAPPASTIASALSGTSTLGLHRDAELLLDTLGSSVTRSRISSRRSGLSASKRSTIAGWVFDGRANPHPPSNTARTPSISITSCSEASSSRSRAQISNFASSVEWRRISGVV